MFASDHIALGTGEIILVSKWVSNAKRLRQLETLLQLTNHSLTEVSIQVANLNKILAKETQETDEADIEI